MSNFGSRTTPPTPTPSQRDLALQPETLATQVPSLPFSFSGVRPALWSEGSSPFSGSLPVFFTSVFPPQNLSQSNSILVTASQRAPD